MAGVEGDEGTEEGRVLRDDDIAWVDEQLRHQVQALLGALENENIISIRCRTRARHAFGDLGPQSGQSRRGRVLQCGRTLLAQDLGIDLLEFGRGEECGIRVPTTEGGDGRIVTVFEQLTDGGGLNANDAIGELR
ncbi:hypothetical protein GCM10009689_03660 [Brevibacterium antiquum]|nr:hypothetical protein [Brevibacterium antiquum]